MSSSSESHGTHDLNATQSGDVASLVVAWLIDDVMLTNIEEAAKEYAAGEHLVVPLVLASTLSSLQEENARLREAISEIADYEPEWPIGPDAVRLIRIAGAARRAALRSLQPIPEEVGK